jgi:hypothetical protein
MRRILIVALSATIVAPFAALVQPKAADADVPGLWVAGDTHVHTDHSSDGSGPRQASDQRLPGNNSVTDQIDVAVRGGLDFLPITDHRTYDQHWDPLWTSSDLILIPGEEANGRPHATAMGAVDQIVDGANPDGSAGYRHVQQSVWQAHSEDANWTVAHPDDGEVNGDGTPNTNASVIGADTVEVFNKASNPDAEIDYAEDRWNHGFRFGVVGASDSHFKEIALVQGPGNPTTWVFAPTYTERGILDGFRAGRTSVSASPTGTFATMQADLDGDGEYDAMGGDEVKASPGDTVALQVRVQNGPGTTAYVYASPGRSAGPISTTQISSLDQRIDVPVTIEEGLSWFRVEVRGPGIIAALGSDPDPNDQLQAVATPLFVYTDEPAIAQPEEPFPAPSTTPDDAALVLGTPGEFTGFSDVATDKKLAHVVAETHTGSRTSILYTRVDKKTTTEPVELAPSSDAARFPRVAAAGDDVWVTWQDERSGQMPRLPDIYLRHSPDGGETWEDEIRLTEGTGRAEHPAIDLLPSGEPVVAWADNRDEAFNVLVQRVGIDEEPIDVSGPTKTVTEGTPDDTRSALYPASLFPSLDAGSGGDIALVWQDNRFDPDPGYTGHTPPPGEEASGGTDPDNWEILGSTLGGAASDEWSEPFSISNNTDLADRHPDVVITPGDDFVVAWETKELHSSGANLSIRSASSTNATDWTTAEPVGLEPAAMSQRPRLTSDHHGDVVAMWYDSRSADWRWNVFAAELTDAGWGPAELVSGDGNNTWPSIDGDTVVFTTDRDQTSLQRDPTQSVYLLTDR